jgi:hypothetical protein
MSRDTWTITVCPTGNGPPPEIRIRRLLKVALRAFGLRCVAVAKEQEPDNPNRKNGDDFRGARGRSRG